MESQWDVEPVDVPRYLASLRRGKWLILLIVVSMTAAVYLISAALPKTYETTARIVMDDRPGGMEPADAETVSRRLATVRALITTRETRARAASSLRRESADSLKEKISATVDEDANIVDVHATDNDPAGAAAIANTVARAFVAMQRAAERQRIADTRGRLQRALTRVRSQRSAEATAIRQRLNELNVTEASAGSDLAIAEPAQPPTEPSTAGPVRNAIFAFFASAFLAVLVVLGLAQLAPRVSGARELSLLTDAPIVAFVPRVRRRRDALAEREAYQELQSALAVRLPVDSKIVVVAGALPAAETSAVAVGLAGAFAQSRRRTLLLSADLRRPRAHEILGLPRSPGLVELLEAETDAGLSPDGLEGSVHVIAVDGGEVDVLTAGGPVKNAAGLLVSEPFSDLMLELERSEYGHVVVEAAALLDSVHGQLVARYGDALLVVCDPERMSPTDAVALGELIRELERPVAGLVALGAQDAGYPAVVTVPRRERSGLGV